MSDIFIKKNLISVSMYWFFLSADATDLEIWPWNDAFMSEKSWLKFKLIFYIHLSKSNVYIPTNNFVIQY